MIDFDKVKEGDKLKIVGAGAPGFANLGDIVTVTYVYPRRVDVVREDGETCYFALTCGAARLEPYDALAALRPAETISELEPVK
jgi:hypothetical protein